MNNKWTNWIIEGGEMPTLDLPDVPEPDVDATEEGLYDLYLVSCMNDGLTPSFKDYTIWVQENYA